MDSLNSLDQIAALIRLKAAQTTLGKADQKDSAPLSKAREKHELQKEKTAETVKHRIVKSIKQINEREPGNNKKMMAVFVENVLTWQFEEELVNDPSFISLIDEVSSALLKEPSLVEQLKKL